MSIITYHFQGVGELIKAIDKFAHDVLEEIPEGSAVYLATDACHRKEFSRATCEELLEPLTD